MNEVYKTPPVVASEDDLLYFIEHHRGTITGIITPECAGWLLKLNTGNRPVMRTIVERFRSILERGMWVNTGEPIIVSRQGVVNDGQHRLTAIHQTGIGAVCDVRFGIEREAFQATGTGVRRSASDVLSIMGMGYTNRVAAIAKLVMRADRGFIGSNQKNQESSDVVAIVNRYPFIHEIAVVIDSNTITVMKTATWGAALTLMARKSSVELALRFADQVKHGQGSETSPTRKLHEKFVQESIIRVKSPTVDRVVMAIKAWNAWVRGRPMSIIRVYADDITADGFPEILSPRAP